MLEISSSLQSRDSQTAPTQVFEPGSMPTQSFSNTQLLLQNSPTCDSPPVLATLTYDLEASSALDSTQVYEKPVSGKSQIVDETQVFPEDGDKGKVGSSQKEMAPTQVFNASTQSLDQGGSTQVVNVFCHLIFVTVRLYVPEGTTKKGGKCEEFCL